MFVKYILFLKIFFLSSNDEYVKINLQIYSYCKDISITVPIWESMSTERLDLREGDWSEDLHKQAVSRGHKQPSIYNPE